jgi:hypothetical protein
MLVKFLFAFTRLWAGYREKRFRHSRWLLTKTSSLWLSLLQLTAIALSLTLVIVPPALALSATAGAILAAPERYDGQSVTLEGTVTHLSERVSQRGNAYYTFDLRDSTGVIRTFSFGKATCTEGMRATVDGTFERAKQVGRYTFYNEVTASRVTCR